LNVESDTPKCSEKVFTVKRGMGLLFEKQRFVSSGNSLSSINNLKNLKIWSLSITIFKN